MGFLKEYEALSSADARRALLFQWLNAHRHELFAELRDTAPVFATPDFFLVTCYEDVKTILEESQRFKARAYPTSGDFVLGKDREDGHDVDRKVLSALLPESDYGRIRDIAAKKAQQLTNAALGKEEALHAIIEKDPVLSQIIHEDKLARGRLDLPAAFARLVPLAVVEEYFGVPEPNPANFGVLPLPRHPDPEVTKREAAARPLLDPNFPSLNRWTSALSRIFRYITFDQYFAPNLALARTLSERALPARKDFSKHLGDLLANPSTAQGSDTLVKRLVKGRGTDDRSLEQTVRDVMGMIGGMIDNVADATCSTIDVLLSHPSALESAVEIAQQIEHAPAHEVEPLRDKLWQYIREALRFAPPTPFLPRTPADDWQHPSGVVVPQWRRMFVAIGSAMMDERKIAHPNEFRLSHLDHKKQQPFVEDDDLFFGSGWHACFGRDIAREQVIEMVRSLLLLPNLHRAPGISGQVEYEHFAPKRLIVEFGPQPVQNALTAVMTIKPPEEAHYRALKLLLSQAYGSVEQLLNQVGTVHFARFIFLENNTKLALITTFDGDFDTYIKNYIELAGPLFDLMLDHIKDAPPLPLREHRNEFVDYVRRCDIGSETPFYSAYGDLTVQEILRRK